MEAGDLNVATQMLVDLLPEAERVADMPLLRDISRATRESFHRMISCEARLLWDGEAFHVQWTRLGDRLNMPVCHDRLALAQNSEIIINSTCLQQQLMEDPFFFNGHEAHLLADALALRGKFHMIFRLDRMPRIPNSLGSQCICPKGRTRSWA